MSEHSRMTKDFIIRMTPVPQRRKNTMGPKKEFYRNVLLKNTLQDKNNTEQSNNNSPQARRKDSVFSNDLGHSV